MQKRSKGGSDDNPLLCGTAGPTQDKGASLVFLGRRTLSKMYLMLHFGRMLSGMRSVRMDTVNPAVGEESVYDYCGLEIHEHPDGDCLRSALPETGMQSVELNNESGCRAEGLWMLDIPDYVQMTDPGSVFLVTDPDRNSLEEGFESVRRTAVHSPGIRVHRVYLDLCEASRINVRYMETLFTRNLPHGAVGGKWLAIAACERDQAAILDNQHDDRLRLSRLSSTYRQLLQEMAVLSCGMGYKESWRLLRMADHKK